MATIVKPPVDISTYYRKGSQPSIFLAGSIEMGKADDWQSRVEQEFENHDVTIFNPRRDDWDSSWGQTLEDKNFVGQVMWELLALEAADFIIMNFIPGTMSPISMLEFGLYARSGKMIVVCPEGFWRKGNIDVTCIRYGVIQVSTIDDAIAMMKQGLKK